MKKYAFRATTVAIIIVLILQTGSVNNNTVSFVNAEPQEDPNPGQKVVDYYREVFEYDWSMGRVFDPDGDGMGFAASRTITASPNFVRKEDRNITSNMGITQILSPDNSETFIVDLINRANCSLLIMQMYFNPGLDSIKNAIINARTSRNVNVSFIIQKGASNTNATAVELMSKGVKIRTFDGTAPLYMNDQHNKGIIVDGRIVLICSINWSPTSVRNNREAGLIIENSLVAQYYTELFYNDWDGCDPYNASTSFASRINPPVISKPILDNGFTNSFISQNNLGSTASVNFPQASSYDDRFAAKRRAYGTVSVRALSSPDNCHEALVQEILSANESIDVSVYTFSNPYIMDAIADRISHGIKVRLLLGRPLGSYELNYNRWTLTNFTVAGIPAAGDPSLNLTAEGLWSSSNFTYQHCKYTILSLPTYIIFDAIPPKI